MKSRLILLLLALLGMGACGGESLDEYGSPMADFEIKGNVTDPQGNPVPNIRVAETGDYGNFNETRSDSKGYYTTEWKGGYSRGTYTFSFTDTDGALNGGDFTERIVEVTFKNADLISPGSGWYESVYSKTIDVTLTPKEDE